MIETFVYHAVTLTPIHLVKSRVRGTGHEVPGGSPWMTSDSGSITT
jgi:hypothetical protein